MTIPNMGGSKADYLRRLHEEDSPFMHAIQMAQDHQSESRRLINDVCVRVMSAISRLCHFTHTLI